MSRLKKLIAIGTTATMLLWSFGMVLPAAHAATIADGDLVKSADSSAVYYIQGANKRVFPHYNVYLSWGYPGDFSTVKTVSASELAAYTDDNSMPFRDGSLFRGTATGIGGLDTTAVFYVENSELRPVLSEQVYQGLFSDTNWVRVTWVPDDLLTKFTYDMGSDLTTSATHPNGCVVKYTGTTQKYLIEGGQKRAISDAAFSANRYLADSVVTIDTDEVYADGSSITGVESGLLTPGWVATTGATTSALTASLVTVAGNTIPQQAENVSVLKVRFTAGTTAATVTGLTFKRAGMGETNDWDSFYLYEGDTLITASGRSLGSDSHEVEFPTINVTIPANSSKTITLRGDGSSSVNGGELHYFQLTSVETTATVTGLPLTGETFTVGQVVVGGLTVAAGSTPANPSVGATEAEIANVKLTAGDNDVEFSQMVLTLSGSLSTSKVTNLKLYRESTLLASAASVSSDDTVTFTLASPYTITDSQEKSFSIKADLAGDVGDTLTTKVEETNHVFAIDKTYDFGANVSGPSVTLATLTLQGGELTMADNGPTASDITKNAQDVTLLKFAMTADRQVEVKRLEVALYGTAAIGSTEISDLKIKDADTGSTLMSKALSTSSCVGGASCVIDVDNGTRTAGTWNAEGLDNRWQLTDSFYLSAGVTRNLIVTVDIGTAAANEGKTIAAYVSEVYYDADQSYMKDTVTGDYLVTADIVPATISGETQSIVASSLTASLASTPVSGLTVVKGAEKVDGVGVVLRAGDGSAIKVTQIQTRVYVDTNLTETTEGTFEVDDEDTTPKGEITVVYLYTDSGTLLSTKTLTNTTGTPDYGLTTFDGLDINIAAGSTAKLIVKYDVSSEAGVRDVAVDVLAANITAYDADDSTVTATGAVNAVSDGATPNYTHIAAGGTLTMAQDATTPNAGIVLAGSTDIEMSKIKFTATDEQWTIEKLRVMLSDSALESSINTVKISYTSGNTAYTKTGSLAAGYVNFSGMGWIIPKDTEATLTIKADLGSINPSIATTGRALKLGVDFDTDFEANGESGGQQTDISSANTYGNFMYLRKSKPTITAGAPNTVLASGTKLVSEFTIAADASGDITVKKFSWDVVLGDIDGGNELDITTWKFYDTSDPNTAIVSVFSDGSTTSSSGAVPIDTAAVDADVLELELDSEIEIGAGTSKTFQLKAVISGVEEYDSLEVSLLNDNNDTANRTGGLVNHATELVNIEGPYSVDFLWSDKARGVNHTDSMQSTYDDWSNGYLLNTFPITNTLIQ